MTELVGHGRAVSEVIGTVAAEAALSLGERLIEAVYHDDLTAALRHKIASVLVAVSEAERFTEKGSVSRRLNMLDQIEGRWRDVLGDLS